jgi:cell division protease FtsH
MNKKLKFVLWIVGVFIFAVICGHFRTPGQVNMPNPNGYHYVRGGSGHTAPAVSSSAAGAPTSTPAAATPPASSAGPPAASACPAAIAQTVMTARGARTVPQTTLPLSAFYQLIDNQPGCISNVTFYNGETSVRVDRLDVAPVTVDLSDDGGKQALMNKLIASKVPFTVTPVDPVASFVSNHIGLIIMLVIGFFVISSLGKMGKKGLTGMGGMGKSRGKDVSKDMTGVKKVTFNDVAGCDEAVKELRRVCKGIVSAGVYEQFGAKIPRGIMLKGPPGTGKTLLARAVANEVDGNFVAESGSAFVEMLVGVGASRVRELFDTARKTVAQTKKPYIIFIDEIDAIGGKRGSGLGSGSNKEHEQTLNQILVEMDGIVSNEGIIIIGATNRMDMLDDALLRPGRFEVHVNVDLPDRFGRVKIFQIHTRKRPLARGVTMDQLADRTFGYSGAEIEGICNRASIIAAERYQSQLDAAVASGMTPAAARAEFAGEVTIEDFDEGIDCIRYGNADESKQARMREEDKGNTAVHEAGHACAAVCAPGVDPVVKITIMRRSKALGYVQTMPDTDRVSFTRTQALSSIVMAMAGRAAQEAILGTCDTGASNDFQQASSMARNMVTKWGMSRLGPISVGEQQAGPFGGGAGNAAFGDTLANEIDVEWRYITTLCYKAAKRIVTSDKARLQALTDLLMKKETVLAVEWKALLEQYPTQVKWEDLELPKSFDDDGVISAES